MNDYLITPDLCMRFLIWSFYYHDIVPTSKMSYASSHKFSPEDARRLDEVKDMVIKLYEEDSIRNACDQFRLARIKHEPCPFTQEELDSIFAKEV